jgi:hypothetical protein
LTPVAQNLPFFSDFILFYFLFSQLDCEIRRIREIQKTRIQKFADGAGGEKIVSNHDDRKRVGLRSADSCFVW